MTANSSKLYLRQSSVGRVVLFSSSDQGQLFSDCAGNSHLELELTLDHLASSAYKEPVLLLTDCPSVCLSLHSGRRLAASQRLECLLRLESAEVIRHVGFTFTSASTALQNNSNKSVFVQNSRHRCVIVIVGVVVINMVLHYSSKREHFILPQCKRMCLKFVMGYNQLVHK